MADDGGNFFWDSCVFYAFLSDSPDFDVNSIARYLEDAKDGKSRIYTSSIALAEVIPSSITKVGIGTFEEFLEDYHGTIIIIDTTPTVMTFAGRLKDLPYRKDKSPGRRLSTGDAIMLSSCVNLIEAYGVKIDAFHTFDNGRKRDPVDGRMVPLLSYDDWCTGFTDAQHAISNKVRAVKRRMPIHPSPSLFLPPISASPKPSVDPVPPPEASPETR